MILWRGWGLLVFPLLIPGVALAFGLADMAEAAGLPRQLGGAVGLGIGALPIWWAGRRMNGRPVRGLVLAWLQFGTDREGRHELYALAVEWWALPMLALAAALLIWSVAILIGIAAP